MLQPIKEHSVLLLCLAAALTALSCAQTGGGRQFLEGRTGIDIGEAPVCGAGVADFDRCKPRDMGGSNWESASNFPAYSLPARYSRYDFLERRDIDRIMADVRAHYLGSPFYAGDVHAICKDGVDGSIFPEGSTTLQDYDLAEVIEDRAVKPVTNRVRQFIQDRDASYAYTLGTRFERHLLDEVHDRVKARVLWFVTRYPGGIADISRERQLRKCLQESRDLHAKVVTGVAGYMIMNNQIDSAISSGEVVNRALDRALRGRADDIAIDSEFRHAIAAEWHGRVSEVANIRMPRRDITATAWPLWVQFQ
jgi:hypothetical protein